jgi:6-methylsalicylate decarboxylase
MKNALSQNDGAVLPAQINRRGLLKSAMAATGSLVIDPHHLLYAAQPHSQPSNVAEDADQGERGGRIDVHLHAILPEYLAALQKGGVTESSSRKNSVNTPSACLEAISEYGVDIAIWLPFSGSGIFVTDDAKTSYLTKATNEAIASFASKVPKRFGFYAILPLPNVGDALKQMEYALDTLGADGIAFLSSQKGVYIGDPAFDELYAEMNRRSVVAFVHPARPEYPAPLPLPPAILEYPFETTRAAINLIYHGVLKQYPNIKWILAHAGGTLPYLSARLEAQQENDTKKPSFLERIPEGYGPYLGRFHYDVAMAGSVGPISALAAEANPSHILYGSDWPYVPEANITQQIAAMAQLPQFAGARLSAMERQNAVRLFKRFARS